MNKILVANRGEIAVRIINAAHQLGYQTVAVYSEVDQNALHVKLADQAILIGKANSSESYLNSSAIIQAAKQVQADGIHPGYGFLAENADFAQACQEAGLIFIGPSPEAIHMMGNKALAKSSMKAAGVPCIPGYSGEDQQLTTLQQQAQMIGLPIYIKAALGGGGRGMRLVQSIDKLAAAIEAAQAEAQSAFGNNRLILEKAITNGRHIEVQILADQQGHTIHLGERDCSLQRRHQKVIEESPSPIIDELLRQQMGEVAVAAGKAIGYVGAGTIEFLLAENGSFYFLEMNTRLQVEHPVTEMVTGIDLVKWQLKIAEGESLSLLQHDVIATQHSIEARLYAEDAVQQFLPQTGKVKFCQFPEAEGIRCDVGVNPGQMISSYYDPMLAKIIAVGDNREQARRRLIWALKQTILLGPTTNRQFLVELLQSPIFVAGKAHCQFIEQYLAEKSEITKRTENTTNNQLIALAAISTTVLVKNNERYRRQGWRNSGESVWYCRLQVNNKEVFNCKLKKIPQQPYQITISNQETVDLEIISVEKHLWHYKINGVTEHAYLIVEQDRVYIASQTQQLNLTKLRVETKEQLQQVSSRVSAPISGCVSKVLVEINQAVKKGDKIAIIEAMKMEHVIAAPVSGRVMQIYIKSGQQVSAGLKLVDLQKQE
ncbi:acetyl/propionyl/methylcrotonyl-CoA carboxylase subunit alpha [Spartinivicinus ruber]|uniref:acetyl/propionyl/methylcrotonyl-CoA carboxylase subunit alpha n=1 Tax=Spartinivicinus ruber TaxID=2683272 RepID=UPI0013D4CA0E|nr:acetyl-CoA carboxylase biotin carboxylase subunit [Spartinivicinus ruber]